MPPCLLPEVSVVYCLFRSPGLLSPLDRFFFSRVTPGAFPPFWCLLLGLSSPPLHVFPFSFPAFPFRPGLCSLLPRPLFLGGPPRLLFVTITTVRFPLRHVFRSNGICTKLCRWISSRLVVNMRFFHADIDYMFSIIGHHFNWSIAFSLM